MQASWSLHELWPCVSVLCSLVTLVSICIRTWWWRRSQSVKFWFALTICWHGHQPKILLHEFPHSHKQAQLYKSVQKHIYYHELSLALSNGCRNCQLCHDGIRIITGNVIKCFNIAYTKYYVPVSYLSRTIVAMTCQYIVTVDFFLKPLWLFYVCWCPLGYFGRYSVKSGNNYKLSCFMKLCPLSGGLYLFMF
jgi:hypothetical protein